MFSFVRRFMTEEQFLKSVTANYYNTVFYASGVWYENIKSSFKTKLTSLHFRLLRTACRDFRQDISRHELTTRCKRATPNEWNHYVTASIALKVLRDKNPKSLHEKLRETYYEERRHKGQGRFFDSSRLLVGRQSLQNRLPHVAQIKSPWNELGTSMTNDGIRILLKKTFFRYLANISPSQIV